jgi:hypothetical protein
MSASSYPATARRIIIDRLLCVPGRSLVAVPEATVSKSHARVLDVVNLNTPLKRNKGAGALGCGARDRQRRFVDPGTRDRPAPISLLNKPRFRPSEARRFRWTS